MKVVLNQDIKGVGKKFEVKDVSDGYACNYLIPNKLAARASSSAIDEASKALSQIEAHRKIQEDLVHKNLKSLAGASVIFEEKASEQGHLFAGIHEDLIAAEIKKQLDVDLVPSFIFLEKQIKAVGEHEIKVKAKGEEVVVKIIVKPLSI